jgi:hypothetical protein
MNMLQAAIENLWYWTYGILVGWGASFTICMGLIIFLFLEVMRLRKTIAYMNSRIIANERELNLYVNKDGIQK